MFNRENYNDKPDISKLSEYINNPLWNKFCDYMKDTYSIYPTFEFSKCSWEYGWNVKFKKNSKNACTIYPRENYFIVMIVIGKKEKALFEGKLLSLSRDIKRIYDDTLEGNGQKWLMIGVEDENEIYDDVKKIIDIRLN